MISRRLVLAGGASAMMTSPAWAREVMNAESLAGDVAILREAYEALHPGLYRYNTPAQIRAGFNTLSRAWSRSPSRAEAYLSLSRFLASIQCGHSYANFYNQSEGVRAELFDPLPRLPFHFMWIDGRMVVERNFSGSIGLAPGTEIVSINGRPTRSILRTLMAFARADGANDNKRRALLGVRGFDRYETFDIFFGLLYQHGSRFDLRVRAPEASRTQQISVGAIDLASRQAAMRTRERSDQRIGWTLTYPDQASALLTMPDWVVYNTRWDWRGYLDAGFADIDRRGVTKLIVDIRGNEGGNDCGDEIIARLIDEPRMRERYERRVRYRRTPEHLNAYLDTWDDSFRNWGDEAIPLGDGFFRLGGAANEEPIQPKGPRFRGAVLVLTDSQNSSATSQFANAIQSGRLGRLVGQPTGGNQRGINGGAFFFLRLPGSGLEVDVPLIGRFPPSPMPNAGLEPDIEISPQPSDIAAGRDVVLAAALAV